MITAITVLIGFLLIGDKSNYAIYAIVAAAILTFFASSAFLSVLNVAIDTIFLSVLEDFERNDGTEMRPYYMSVKLKTLLLSE